jgi:glycosyltransferase involved in cell wall biosynthesis
MRPSHEAAPTALAAALDGMRVAHIMRKYNPLEWGGTETAVHRLFVGLRRQDVRSVVFCPRLETEVASPSPGGEGRGEGVVFFPPLQTQIAADPLAEAGCAVKRFRAFLPVLGLTRTQRAQHRAVGGNLMSLDLPFRLWGEPNLSVIHTHALGRLGGIASLVARGRALPLVATIHGGFLDLPAALRESFRKSRGGWEWGRIFGLLLRSRQLLRRADAILTCNPKEAALLREQFPGKRIVVQPHGVSMRLYRSDCREQAREAFPQIRGRELLLCVGRIDPVKNQSWLVEESGAIFQRHPGALLVLAGACTDERYGESLRASIRERGLQNQVLLAGGLPPGDGRLVGLMQAAHVLLLPSISETFGLVIIEAWAAGTAVIASRTSGAAAMIRAGENGWLFEQGDRRAFHEAVDTALLKPEIATQYAAAGQRLAEAEYDNDSLAGRMKNLYARLIEEKHALRNPAG